MSGSFVIRGADLVTMEPGRPVLRDQDLVVRDGTIEAIGQSLEDPDGLEVVDGTDRVVVPGFVDTHRHLWQTTLRGTMPNCSLGEYFGRIMIGTAPLVQPEDVYIATLAGVYELLNAGITSVVDWANVTNTPGHADAGLQALRDGGIRATYAYGWPGGPAYLLDSTLPHPTDARRVAEQVAAQGAGRPGGAPAVGFALALRGPASNGEQVLRDDWALARDLEAPITVHVGMRIGGIDRHDVDALDALGLLGPDTTYVHCNSLSDDELRRIRDSGGSTSVSSYCESVMGHGRPPTARLVGLGMLPSLSADVGVTVPGDMFSHMRSTWSTAREHQQALGGERPPTTLLTVEDVLAMATRAGAAAMGNGDVTGTVSVGKQADLVLLRRGDANTMLCDDPIAMTVAHCDTSNIDSVFVAGRAVKRDGRLVGVDLPALRRQAEESRERVLASAAAGGAGHRASAHE